MDYQTVIQAISTIGFPCIAFLLMYRMVDNSIKELKEVVEKNTNVLTEVISLLKQKEVDK